MVLGLLAVGSNALVVPQAPLVPGAAVTARTAAPLMEAGGKLRANSLAERRKMKLETGTNWKPRTSPQKWDSDGYYFFQGENFADIEIRPVQAIITATGLASFAAV